MMKTGVAGVTGRPDLTWGWDRGEKLGHPDPGPRRGKTVHTVAAPFEEAQGSVGTSLAPFSIWVAELLPKLKPQEEVGLGWQALWAELSMEMLIRTLEVGFQP